VVKEYEQKHTRKDSPALLESVTTFVGGGGPRFWFSVSPEQQQQNYAQVLVQLSDKEATPGVISQLQSTLSKEIAGAYITVHQLQTNPVEFPVEVQISGTSDVDPQQESADNEELRLLAGRVQDILRPIRGVQVVQTDWFQESPEVKLGIDPDRANLAGITNRDIAASTTSAMSGTAVTTLREGNQQIPVIARLRSQERAQLSDVENLYVYSSQGSQKVPLRTVSTVANEMVTERIRRQEHFRTIGVHAFPQPGVLPSEILGRAMPQLTAFKTNLPAGYRLQIGGEQAKQEAGFANLAKVLIISILGILRGIIAAIRQRSEAVFGSGSRPVWRRRGLDMPRDHGVAFRI
jgi:multidrug efflux pump subunit AcrB